MDVTIGDNKKIKNISLIDEEKRNTRTMPPSLSIILIFIIIGIVITARGSIIATKEIAAQSNKVILFEDKGLNENEKMILTMLSTGMEASENNIVDSAPLNYTNYLMEYLSSNGVHLSLSKANAVADMVKEIDSIISSEEHKDFKNMSLEGRGVAIYLAEHIYNVCGLTLVYNLRGEIERISDSTGNVVYNNKIIEQEEFKLNVLVITLTILLILFVTCYVLTKKNQLLNKKGIYDGFDEKKFTYKISSVGRYF